MLKKSRPYPELSLGASIQTEIDNHPLMQRIRIRINQVQDDVSIGGMLEEAYLTGKEVIFDGILTPFIIYDLLRKK